MLLSEPALVLSALFFIRQVLRELGMKPDIHPEYRDVLFYDTSADTYFVVGSTVQTNETKDYEGQTYPYMTPVSYTHLTLPTICSV